MSLKKQKIIVILCLVFLTFVPHFVSAAGLVPCGSNGQNPCTVTDIFILVAQVTDWLIGIAGVYAVFKLIQAGFWMAVSVGNEEAITQRKKQVENTVLGFVMVMFAYMFINTMVNVELTRSIVTGNTACQLNLQQPLTYLSISPASNCNSVNDATLHSMPGGH